MKVNHLHLMVPDVPAAVGEPVREHAYSFYVPAPGGFLVEVGA